MPNLQLGYIYQGADIGKYLMGIISVKSGEEGRLFVQFPYIPERVAAIKRAELPEHLRGAVEHFSDAQPGQHASQQVHKVVRAAIGTHGEYDVEQEPVTEDLECRLHDRPQLPENGAGRSVDEVAPDQQPEQGPVFEYRLAWGKQSQADIPGVPR